MQEGLDAFKSGQVAMHDELVRLLPGPLQGPGRGRRQDRLLRQPDGEGRGLARWAARASRWSATRDKQEEALEYIKWFAQPEVQKKWWALGGYSCHNAVLLDPGFPATAPFAADFLKAMSGVKDFWQEPAYAELLLAMQKRVHDYVVAGQGTAQEALDAIVKDWTEVFEDDGKL